MLEWWNTGMLGFSILVSTHYSIVPRFHFSFFFSAFSAISAVKFFFNTIVASPPQAGMAISSSFAPVGA